jgi:hypothetical protein
MKLNKALKIKNRKAGEINRLRSLIQRENSKKVQNYNGVKVANLANLYHNEMSELISLKAKIQKATAPIAEKLIELSELKGEIVFYQSLNTKSGIVERDNWDNDKVVTEEWKAYFDQDAVDDNLRIIQIKIENLQDEIDEYNASTSI